MRHNIIMKIHCTYVYFLSIDTCDTNWQSTRDGLIITAFVFSLLPFLYYSIIFAGVIFCFKKGKYL